MSEVLSLEKIAQQIAESNYISRDLSWLQFNYRVLEQAKHTGRSIFDRLKFLAITSSNLDEFCTIRLGSLYNYIDYGKERFDYNGLREEPFRRLLLSEMHRFTKDQNDFYVGQLKPLFRENGFMIAGYEDLSPECVSKVNEFFNSIIFPMLTPMVFDNYHTFPVLMNNRLLFGVVTKNPSDNNNQLKVSFIQVPHNLPRFYEIPLDDVIQFVPVEDIISQNIHNLFRNVEIASINLFRINRNGDFTLEESEDIESNFLEDLKRKIKTRRSGRVVRLEVEGTPDPWMMRLLKIQWDLDEHNIFSISKESMLDFSGLQQIVQHNEFKAKRVQPRPSVKPLNFPEQGSLDLFEVLKERDILLHHPYNSMEPVLELLEKAADDPFVLSIKITIYRVAAKESRVTSALLKAAENGKHVAVLFEVKARFDEENNLREAQRLQKAGCFVIYGVSSLKTHTKLLLIVRKEEGDKVFRYVHLSSGNYNERTSKLYVDIGLLTTREVYANDVSEFFNVITGHSQPSTYRNLITSPRDMRIQLCNLIQREAENARNGIPAGVVIKLNSLQDKEFIDNLYEASQAGVKIKLIIRGMCCLRPGRKGVSENIEVLSIVGEYLEHSRIYYFHNAGKPKVYIGSADAMVRSFDRRIESLFSLEEDILKRQAINNLFYNLKDNVNAYILKEDGSYVKKTQNGEPAFNMHKEFYNIDKEIVLAATLI
ncbi:MAG TPA: polyphosphate kinase 1 [Chryseosolibacter sp.]|nr:polyphosphate kinase 1 [Chryseosolibacter sp.]